MAGSMNHSAVIILVFACSMFILPAIQTLLKPGICHPVNRIPGKFFNEIIHCRVFYPVFIRNKIILIIGWHINKNVCIIAPLLESLPLFSFLNLNIFMKSIKVAAGFVAFYILCIGLGTQLSSCTKPLIVYDTVTQTVNLYDTVVNTITINDTIDNAELKEGLVAYFPFKNGSLNDFSGHDNNIVFNNAAPIMGKAGLANSAYLFNGVNSYMRIRNSASLNPQNITIMAVVKINDFYRGPCHGNQIIGKGTPDYTKGFYILRFNDYATPCHLQPNTEMEYFGGEFGDNNPMGTASSAGGIYSGPIKKSTWYDVVYTYNGIESRMYINGVLNDVKVKASIFTPNSNDVFIGRHEDLQYPYYFNGIIDEIRIYNRALPASQVQKLSQR
jgi:hypothetical protein